MTDKPKWNGGFDAARRIAVNILADHLGPSDRNSELISEITEALVEAFDNGVLAEHNAREKPYYRRKLLTELLYERGVGIATLDEMKDRTLAVARGELKLLPGEPKLWFTSIESMVESLRTIGGDHDDGDVELYEECIRTKRPIPKEE